MSDTRAADPDISPEYDFDQGERAKYLDRARRGLRLSAPKDGRLPTAPTSAAENLPKPGPTKR